MSGYVIDLFFSFSDRANRREWLLGTLVLTLAAFGGIALFNDNSFDESAYANPDIPTMAAFLWMSLVLFAFVALSAKRLREAGRPAWMLYTIAIPAFIALCAWGSGLFAHPFVPSLETLGLGALLAVMIPAVIGCATRPAKQG